MRFAEALLSDLHDGGISFLRDAEIRALHTVVPPWMRGAALKLLRNLALRPECRGPVLVADMDCGEDPGDWEARTSELRAEFQEWGARADAADLPTIPAPRVAAGIVGFAEQLGQVLLARPDDEIVVVLILGESALKRGWADVVALLANSLPLRPVRWLVVDVGVASISIAEVVEGPVMVVWPSTPDGGAASLPGRGPASLGAGPKVGLTPRRSRSPVPEAEGTTRATDIANHVREASEAMSHGNPARGLESQCRARDLSATQADHERTVVLEMALGSQLLAAGRTVQAIVSYERSVAVAQDDGRPRLSAITLLGLGCAKAAHDDLPGGLVALAEASRSAIDAGEPLLVVEICRLAGELALAMGMEGQAAAFWSRAVSYGAANPTTAMSRSVGLCAETLRRLCATRGVQPRLPESLSGNRCQAPAARAEPRLANTERLRGWTPAERKVLGESTSDLPKAEFTAVLTSDDIASVHGWAEPPDPSRVPSGASISRAGVTGVLDARSLEGETVWLDPQALEELRRRYRADSG